MEAAELNRRIQAIRQPQLSLWHAQENFFYAEDLDRKRSALRDFLNAWHEFTWVMRKQMESVAGGKEAFNAWWEEATQHLKADATCSFFWRIRAASAHEGVLAVRQELVTDLPQAELERMHELPGNFMISAGVQAIVVIEDAPPPLDRFPAHDLMDHARSMSREVLVTAMRDFNPTMIHRARDADGNQVDVDVNVLLDKWRFVNAQGPYYRPEPIWSDGKGGVRGNDHRPGSP